MSDADGPAVAITSRGTTRWIEIEAADIHQWTPASRARLIEQLIGQTFDGELELTIIEKDSGREPQYEWVQAADLDDHRPVRRATQLDALFENGFEGKVEVQLTQLRHRRAYLRSA